MDTVTVTLGFICYNTKSISLECFDALVRESERLTGLGAAINLMIYDNGSDDTWKAMVDKYGDYTTISVKGDYVNVGLSRARNALIESALEVESDLLILIDGDIQVVPLSLCLMTQYMMGKPRLGCLSAHPTKQTNDPELASKVIFQIERIQNDLTNGCAGYSIFNCNLFRDGVRFIADGPFGGPGWGLEDDDFYLEVIAAGWEVFYFTGMVYLQKKIRSSWAGLYKDGVNITEVFKQRQDYFLKKWSARGASSAILKRIQVQDIPEYTPEPTETQLGYRMTKWGKFTNYECIKCQYSTLWIEKMNKHQRFDKHPWAYPGQFPKREDDPGAFGPIKPEY